MRRDVLEPFLRNNGVVILDGAMATELERRGADLHDALWSAKVLVEAPELIRQVHYDYFAAGADVAITASYQATFEGYARIGLSHEAAARRMQLSVELARAARDAFWQEETRDTSAGEHVRRRPVVAASIGPYGAFLANGAEYTGDYGLSVEALMDFHRPRMAVMVETGADLLACETIPSQAEGEALVRLLAEFPHVVAWLSFSCCDGTHVCHGELFADCVAAAESVQVIAAGLNCTAPAYVDSLLTAAAGSGSTPRLVYPNRGERWDAVARCWVEGTGTEDFADAARRWYASGCAPDWRLLPDDTG